MSPLSSRFLRVGLPLLMFYAVASLPQTATAQSPRCPGQSREPHAYGSSTFWTTSRIEPAQSGRYRHGVISCADNADPRNPLYVRWLIPGPHGWVPPGGMLESVPRLREDERAPQLSGCLFYGDRPDTTRGTFFGVAGDDGRAELERQKGCAVAAAAPGKAGPIEKVFLKIRNFFPSDKTKAASTMLQLDGEVGIDPLGGDSYRSVFRYEISRPAGSEGSPNDVTLRPTFQGAGEVLLAAFSKANPDDVRLRQSGAITFEVAGIKSAELQYVTYALFDREKRLVAGIDIPVFVAGR